MAEERMRVGIGGTDKFRELATRTEKWVSDQSRARPVAQALPKAHRAQTKEPVLRSAVRIAAGVYAAVLIVALICPRRGWYM